MIRLAVLRSGARLWFYFSPLFLIIGICNNNSVLFTASIASLIFSFLALFFSHMDNRDVSSRYIFFVSIKSRVMFFLALDELMSSDPYMLGAELETYPEIISIPRIK